METPQQPTQKQPTEKSEEEIILEAKQILIDIMMTSKDHRTEVLAASGLMNYYLAAEIGSLVQLLFQPPVIGPLPDQPI